MEDKSNIDFVMDDSSISKKHWMKEYWRPMMGWCYMLICLFDFVINPIVYNFLQLINGDQTLSQWHAISLENGGLIHLSFGAILGIAAHSRGLEKINRKE